MSYDTTTDNNEFALPCPICGDGEMEYKKLKNPKSMSTDDKGIHATHIWVCNECPGILMEWYDNEDTRTLDEYLNRPRGDYK